MRPWTHETIDLTPVPWEIAIRQRRLISYRVIDDHTKSLERADSLCYKGIAYEELENNEE